MIRLESSAIVQIEDRIALFIDMEATTLPRGGDRRPIERSEGRDLSYASLLMKVMYKDTSYGIVGSPSSTAYHAAKGAICIFTKEAAIQ